MGVNVDAKIRRYTTMVFDTATGMLPATAGQTTSYVLNCPAPGSGLVASRSNEVCFQYFDQKPGHTLQDQDPALYHIFAKYGGNITVSNNNGNCAGRGFTTQIANPVIGGSPVTTASFFRH